MENKKSTILTSRRLATLLLTGLFTGVFVGASTKYPFLAEHIDTAILAASLVVSVGFSAFTITDVDFGKQFGDITREIGIEIDEELLAALEPKIQGMIMDTTAKLIQTALDKRQ